MSDAQVQQRFNAGSNTNADATLTLAGFVNGTNENGVPAYNPTQLSSYFDNVDYIGAVRDANDTWYRDWTCNSATLDLGSANGSCTRLPVY